MVYDLGVVGFGHQVPAFFRVAAAYLPVVWLRFKVLGLLLANG
jgi:hypothetical protein